MSCLCDGQLGAQITYCALRAEAHGVPKDSAQNNSVQSLQRMQSKLSLTNVLADGAQKSIQGFSPSALSLYHTGTSLSTAVWALFTVCFLGEAKELYDTQINYSCSKASTEGCMEVSLRDHYIIPTNSSQWVKMFWHKVGKNIKTEKSGQTT